MPRPQANAAWHTPAPPPTASPPTAETREGPHAPKYSPRPARPPASAPAPAPPRHCISSSKAQPCNPWPYRPTFQRVSDREHVVLCVRCAQALRRDSSEPAPPGLTTTGTCGCWPLPSSFLKPTSSSGRQPRDPTALVARSLHASKPSTIPTLDPRPNPSPVPAEQRAPAPQTPNNTSHGHQHPPNCPNPALAAINTNPHQSPKPSEQTQKERPRLPTNSSSRPNPCSPIVVQLGSYSECVTYVSCDPVISLKFTLNVARTDASSLHISIYHQALRFRTPPNLPNTLAHPSHTALNPSSQSECVAIRHTLATTRGRAQPPSEAAHSRLRHANAADL